jgi:ribonuclease D
MSGTSELERLRAEVERLAEFGVKERERHEAKLASLQALADRCREKDWAYADERVRERDEARAERDALKATVQRVQSIAGQWVAQAAAADDGDELVPVLANVGRTILAALNTPTPTTRTETA